MTAIKKPRPAILGTFDATSYTGNLWDRHGAQVTNFTTSVAALSNGEGHFDIIGFLNGYGSRAGETINDLFVTTGLTQVSSFSAGFDDNDRFYIEANKPLRTSKTSFNDHKEIFGFTGEQTAVDQGGGVYRLTATNRWQRGVFELNVTTGAGLQLSHVTGSESFTADGTPTRGTFANGNFYLNFTHTEMTPAQANNYQVGSSVKDSNDNTWIIVARTNLSSSTFLEFNPVGHSEAFPNDNTINRTTADNQDVLPFSIRVQNLITFFRQRASLGDADDKYYANCLENSDFVSGKKIRWILEADGKVSVNFQKNLVPFETFINATATGKALLKRLGFDGTETYVEDVVNGISRIKANNVAPCVLIADRGYSELRREVAGRDEFSMMADGSVVSSGLIPVKGWRIVFKVLGPAYGYTEDRERHLRNWWQYARRGLTIYPTFGDGDRVALGGNDTRRHIDLIDIYETQTATQKLFQTPDADRQENHFGKRVGGRLLVRRHPADAQARREAYSGDLDVFQEISLRLLDDPSR
jgi:hypothetical protein